MLRIFLENGNGENLPEVETMILVSDRLTEILEVDKAGHAIQSEKTMAEIEDARLEESIIEAEIDVRMDNAKTYSAMPGTPESKIESLIDNFWKQVKQTLFPE